MMPGFDFCGPPSPIFHLHMATYDRNFSTGAHQFNLATSPATCGGFILTKRYLPTDSEVQIHLSTADARCLLIHLQLALALTA